MPATPPAATPVAALGSVQWTSATDPRTMAPVDAVTEYRADAPRIIAAIDATALPAGAVVAATWDYNNTSLDAFASQVRTSAAAAKQWVAFTLSRDPDVLWPTGTYRVTITLNGAPAQQASVEVVNPG